MHAKNSVEMFQTAGFRNRPAIIIGTGPSLDVETVKEAQSRGALLFGVNNTFNDFDLDVWIACDPSWHKIYSPVVGRFHKWHWDKSICEKNSYQHIEGRWGDGLSLSPEFIHYGHSSGYQALNLAVLYGCNPIFLVGYDMHYRGASRHYFNGLSNDSGEYPQQLRKFSKFDGLIKCYETIANQKGLPDIINCTIGSALTCFPFKELLCELDKNPNLQEEGEVS